MVASSKLGALLAGHELAEARKRKAIAAAMLLEDTRKKKKRRNTPKRQRRFDWDAYWQRKTPAKWKKTFRVTKERFTWLANHERLQHLKPKRRDGISVNVQLAVALRFVAGGSYIDIADIFGISEENTLFDIVYR